MIFQTPILALLLVALLTAVTALWSGGFAVQVLRRWDFAVMSRAQLRLERLTELVSTRLVRSELSISRVADAPNQPMPPPTLALPETVVSVVTPIDVPFVVLSS